MGFGGEGFPRAYFTSLAGRTVDLEATRRLESEMDAAADNAGSPSRAGRGGAPPRRNLHPPPPPMGSRSREARGPRLAGGARVPGRSRRGHRKREKKEAGRREDGLSMARG
ncbi:unnamed protein product [Ectocarpus sp. 8 AP-2014]